MFLIFFVMFFQNFNVLQSIANSSRAVPPIRGHFCEISLANGGKTGLIYGIAKHKKGLQ